MKQKIKMLGMIGILNLCIYSAVAVDITTLVAESKTARLVYSQTINLNSYAGYSGYTVSYDKKGVIVFYYNINESGNVSQIWGDFYNNKDGTIYTSTTTSIPEYQGEYPAQVRFEGVAGKCIIIRFRYSMGGGENVWEICNFKDKKGILTIGDNTVEYADSSLNGTVQNNKVFVKYTNTADGKIYVARLNIALKKVKDYINSSESLDEMGSQNNEDYWVEDYTNEAGDTRYIKCYKI